MTYETSGPHWGVAYHANSASPRSQKWYRISRVIKVDGQWFELYSAGAPYSGRSLQEVRAKALSHGLPLLQGTFTRRRPGRINDLIWSVDKGKEGKIEVA